MRLLVIGGMALGLAAAATAGDLPRLESPEQEAATLALLRDVAARLDRIEKRVRPMDPGAPPLAAKRELGPGKGSDKWRVELDLRSAGIGAVGTLVAVGSAVAVDRMGGFDKPKAGFAAIARELGAWTWPWEPAPEPAGPPEPEQKSSESQQDNNGGTVINVQNTGSGTVTVNVETESAP